jgi:Holliday junction DNA helicase RuvA
MIASISGIVEHIDSKFVIIDVNNIGYRVYTSTDNTASLTTGNQVKFFTYLVVREDALDLYGFQNKNDLRMFEMLISVSGIGPKGAINILSSVSIEALINAIRTGSHSHLTKVSGIGRKTAEKIVLELKDKVDNIVDSNNTTNLSSDSDAIEALKMLGYNAEESRNALKKINRDIIDTGEKVKAALKVLN